MDLTKYFQQGDLLLFSEPELPAGALPKPGQVVMAGELTGHAHRLAADGLLFERNGVLYISTPAPVPLTHEEHKTQTLQPGTYRVGRVREYDHLSEETRAILD